MKPEENITSQQTSPFMPLPTVDDQPDLSENAIPSSSRRIPIKDDSLEACPVPVQKASSKEKGCRINPAICCRGAEQG